MLNVCLLCNIPLGLLFFSDRSRGSCSELSTSSVSQDLHNALPRTLFSRSDIRKYKLSGRGLRHRGFMALSLKSQMPNTSLLFLGSDSLLQYVAYSETRKSHRICFRLA